MTRSSAPFLFYRRVVGVVQGVGGGQWLVVNSSPTVGIEQSVGKRRAENCCTTEPPLAFTASFR